MGIDFRVSGIIKMRTLTSIWEDEALYREHWHLLPEEEKYRYILNEQIFQNTVYNTFTTFGVRQMLYAVAATSFSSYLALGTGATSGVSAQDTGVIGESLRKTPNTIVVPTNLPQLTISTPLSASDLSGQTITNAGLIGNGTSTSGSGTTSTRALMSYLKPNSAVSCDYTITITVV